jgi:hypothetical protein
MNCFIHGHTAAVGVCTFCQKAVCHDCVGKDMPRLLCRTCIQQSTILGFEYRSSASIAGWPLIHICAGVDPATMRPRVAKGIVAIGNIAVGVVAIAGLACGLVTIGGVSLGLLFALGGVALGFGMSMGGLAVGSIALGGVAVGFSYAIGGAAFAPAIIDGKQCDPAVVDLIRRWLGSVVLPPACQ